MAALDNKILHILSNRESWDKYREYVPEDSLSIVSRRLLERVDEYWKKYPGESAFDWDFFEGWLGAVADKDTHLPAMLQTCRINKEVGTTEAAEDILNLAKERDVVERLLPELEETTLDLSKIRGMLDELEDFTASEASALKNVVSTDINDILEASHISEGGLPFPLEVLRTAVGPLRPGDTVLVPARPEVGKTTFLLHTIAHMMMSTEDTCAVVFSNEEDGKRVMLRLYQAVLNRTAKEILANPTKARDDYRDVLGDPDRIKVVHASSLHRKEVERHLKAADPDVVGFNLLSKIEGFRRGVVQNDSDMYTAQGKWMRDMANDYQCATITGWQAGADAHGVPWIEQHHLFQSKTGLLGEADVVLGIGQRHDPAIPENLRYLHPSKNKLVGDSKTIESMRHGYFDGVYIDAERGRFYEK